LAQKSNRIINWSWFKYKWTKYKKGKYLKKLFREVAIDMVGNNHEMRVSICMAPPHEKNTGTKDRQVNVSMNIKGKLLTVQFSLLRFIRTHATYIIERKVLFEKYRPKPVIPVDLAVVVNAFENVIGLDNIVETYGWKSKTVLIQHMIKHWESVGRENARREAEAREVRIQQATRARIEQEQRNRRYGY
jgi:hypothetical protein